MHLENLIVRNPAERKTRRGYHPSSAHPIFQHRIFRERLCTIKRIPLEDDGN